MINWIRKLFGISPQKNITEPLDTEPITNQDVKELLAGLRGLPEKCDFCGKPKPLEELHPEEGGEWVCSLCLEQWQEEEKKRDRHYGDSNHL